MHIINGELVSDVELRTNFVKIISDIKSSLCFKHDIGHVIETLNQFSQKIKKIDPDLSLFCSKQQINKKISRELGEEPFTLKRVSYKENVFEAWKPIGVVTHILPSNAPELPPYALIEGILSGNYNIVKVSKNDNSKLMTMLEILFECDYLGTIAKKISVLQISSKDKDILEAIINISNGVSAWGGDSAIKSVREMMPVAARFIPWGHKISFAYFTKDMLSSDEHISKLASEIAINNQQACSAPQFVYCETHKFGELVEFGKKLGHFLETCSSTNPLGELSLGEQTEITNIVQLAKLESLIEDKLVLESPSLNWRILIENSSAPKASPLNRTVIVKPIDRDKLGQSIFPIRNYLQTVGLVSSAASFKDVTSKLFEAGVTRVTNIGEMLSSYTGEPHDGVYALSRFCTKISLVNDLANKLSRVESKDNLTIPFLNGVPLMTKEDFKNQVPDTTLAHLYFKSGGSSGTPTLSTFSYDGYHKEMAAGAEGLFAAGLDPANDRVMNCFFGGALYGGFLSFYTILEKLQAVQFPMGAHQDFEFVASIIVSKKVNAIMGMPSYLIQLFNHQEEVLKQHKTIKKIFYGGEHFSDEQRNWLKSKFGVEIIRSATYGSVDAGPLGFQCEFCKGGEHHLNSQLQFLEILKVENDEPVVDAEIGRMVFTSMYRESLTVKRYDIGDLGRWVLDDCPCGRANPKFELLGRHGDIFRVGGNFLNYMIFQKYLKEHFNYHDEFQIIIEKSIAGDKLNLCVLSSDYQEIEAKLLDCYDWLIEAVLIDKTVKFNVTQVSLNDLLRTPGSGKLIRVIDRR